MGSLRRKWVRFANPPPQQAAFRNNDILRMGPSKMGSFGKIARGSDPPQIGRVPTQADFTAQSPTASLMAIVAPS